MRRDISRVLLACIFLHVLSSVSSAYDLDSRYATIVYSSEDYLRRFNKEISLGSLAYLMSNKRGIMVTDEVRNKIDVIVERVETILEMFPKKMKFTIALLSSEDEVQDIYRKKYGRKVDFIAFYSPKDKTVFISVKDTELTVLAHEIAHAIIDFYYGMSTPAKIHEVLAQYVESHLKD